MLQPIEVILTEDKLNKRVWSFTYIDGDHVLVLTEFTVQSRKSARHAWRITKRYHRLRRLTADVVLELKDVPVTDWVRSTATDLFMQSLRVVTVLR
jgi:hypothetical protein